MSIGLGCEYPGPVWSGASLGKRAGAVYSRPRDAFGAHNATRVACAGLVQVQLDPFLLPSCPRPVKRTNPQDHLRSYDYYGIFEAVPFHWQPQEPQEQEEEATPG